MAGIDETLQAIARRLNSFNLAQGKNITLNETQSGVEISANALGGFGAKLKRWILGANDKLKEIKRLRAGRNVTFEEGPSEIVIHAAAQQAVNAKASIPSEQAHPFKTVLDGDGGATVLGYNPDERRYFRNYATLGLTRLELPETALGAIASDCWTYVKISYSTSASSYQAEITTESELPQETNSAYIVPIAFIKSTDGKPSEVQQVQHGPIEGAGRIF